MDKTYFDSISFGLTSCRKEVAVSDFLESLRSLGRLVAEATKLARKAK
jgi:hypothetical protein